MALEKARYLDILGSSTNRIIDLTKADPSSVVPSCPGWDLAGLAGHLGRVQRWSTAIVRSGQMTGMRDLERPPEDKAQAADYLARGLAELNEVLGALDPLASIPNFTSSEPRGSFWIRRQAQEAMVHGWDAELAAGKPNPFDRAAALDGIEEQLDVMMPFRVASLKEPFTMRGSVHLHCTDTSESDGSGEWLVSNEGGEWRLEQRHAKGDVAVRGTASNLLLALWGRLPASSPALEVFGDPAIFQELVVAGN